MSKPVEFGEFYKLLKAVRDGNEKKSQELDWILAEYEHAKEASSAYDELGQIFCHHGVMELYEYAGVDDIEYIYRMENSIWDYLNVRMKIGLDKYMVKSMTEHAKEHKLATRVANKWDTEIDEIESNLEGLAKYVTEGIIGLIK